MNSAQDEDDLIGLSHKIVRAIAGRDERALDEILADDFVHLTSGDEPAQPQDRQEFMSAITTATYEIVNIELSSLQVKFTDDIAVVVGIQNARVRLADKQMVTSAGSFTDVFLRFDGRWRLWLAHSTELRAC